MVNLSSVKAGGVRFGCPAQAAVAGYMCGTAAATAHMCKWSTRVCYSVSVMRSRGCRKEGEFDVRSCPVGLWLQCCRRVSQLLHDDVQFNMMLPQHCSDGFYTSSGRMRCHRCTRSDGWDGVLVVASSNYKGNCNATNSRTPAVLPVKHDVYMSVRDTSHAYFAHLLRSPTSSDGLASSGSADSGGKWGDSGYVRAINVK